MPRTDYDAIVIGSGPNGLAAAITLQSAGLSVLLLEGRDTVGGGMRSAELTLPGFVHDVCSAIHPMAAASPFFRALPLHKFGLEYIHPPVLAAHPFDGGHAAILSRSLEQTASALGEDQNFYLRTFRPLLKQWPDLAPNALRPIGIPRHPLGFSRFGLKAITSARSFARKFRTREAQGLFAGMAAHSVQPLTNLSSAAIGIVLMTAGHASGWPIARGGSQSIADALASYFASLGGTIETGSYVTSLSALPPSRAILLDVTPRQLLEIAGHSLSSVYRWQLRRYRYGLGIFKMDWALDGPVPFTAPDCHEAGTVHLGNTLADIVRSEDEAAHGIHPERPFVLLAQQSRFDPSRVPEGKQTAWAYCHVPNGSDVDMTEAMEKQVERFAPGFRDRVLARRAMNASAMENYNPNYIGGDIGGGAMDISQLFVRPALRLSPYRTSAKGVYLCSSSTPPGGGVHGMCGYHAARQALKDIFQKKDPLSSRRL